MYKRILPLLAVAMLSSCATRSLDHLTASPNNPSEISRVHAWVADKKLEVQLATDIKIMGIGIGTPTTVVVPYSGAVGLMGIMMGAAVIHEIEESTRKSVLPLQAKLVNYDFEKTFRLTLREKILDPGLLPADNLSYETPQSNYYQWQSGTVGIAAYQRISEDFTSLWTGISVYRFDKTKEGEAVHRSAYLYVFKLPEPVTSYDNRQLNASLWSDNPALVEHQLNQGMAAAMEMLARDLEGRIDLEGADPVEINAGNLGRLVPDAYLVSKAEDRSVIAIKDHSLIVSVPNSSIKGNDPDQRSLDQIKLAEGIDDSAYQEFLKTVEPDRPAVDPEAMPFLGQAEDEVANKNYDENLWSTALVLAEGDRTKQDEKYIELRARQLAGLEPIGEDTTTTASVQTTARDTNSRPPETKIDGVYKAKVGAKGYFFQKGSSRSFELEIRQVGEKVLASSNKHDLVLHGVRKGNKIDFECNQVNSVSGLFGFFDGSWEVSGTGDDIRLTGKWAGITHAGSGKFNLVKLHDL